MARLRYTAAAKDDLESIAPYIAEKSGSRATAERFIGHIRQKYRDLAASPTLMGRPRAALRSDMRSYPFRNYVIFFRYLGGTLEVVNVLERHRDVEGYFRDVD